MLRDPSLIPLSQQHHNGLALCVLTERALGQDQSAESVARLAQRVVDRYEIELTNHFAMEEQLLFPAARACDPALVDELVAEHRRLEDQVGRLRSQPTPALLEEFTALLRSHIRKEENKLFEEIQTRLPRETLDAIGAEIDRLAVRVCL